MTIRFALGHSLLKQFVRRSGHAFQRDNAQLQACQRQRLQTLLRAVAMTPLGQRRQIDDNWSWEQFADALPETSYPDWQQSIVEQRMGGAGLIASPVTRYQPTSGSTSAIKWIPYTRRFLGELDQAISPWLLDLYQRFPAIQQGTHYWSLSWVPTSLRGEMRGQINDDMKLLSAGKRLIATLTQSAPETIAEAESSEDSQFATLAWLIADDRLSMLSVWSPTFALSMFEQMARWRLELARCLTLGHWGERSASLVSTRCPRDPLRAALLHEWNGKLEADFFAELWPQLVLVSAWDTASAGPWASKLRRLLPHADFQGKGLWATEGVVTIPWGGQYPLAYRSHVYEFADADTGRVFPPWQLQPDQEVVPLISTGSGLLRYRMNDRLRVTGHFGAVPCFTFLGRNDGVDLVGEKLSSVMVQEVLDKQLYRPSERPVTLLALDDADGSGLPGYVLLLQSDRPFTVGNNQLARSLEQGLLTFFHYRLARDLGQLAPVRVLRATDMHQRYLDFCQRRGMVEGNVKIEPLRYWPGVQLADIVPAQIMETVA